MINNIILNKVRKFTNSVFFPFILIFLTAFFTKYILLIFKRTLVFKEINFSFLLFNINYNTKYFLIIIPLLILYIISLFKYKLEWIEFSKPIKKVVFISTLILVWSTVFSDFNYYENTWFLTDRILIVVLATAIYFKPTFIFLFIFYFYLFIEQFDYLPFWSFSTTHTSVLINTLMATWVYQTINKLLKKQVNSNLLFVVFLGILFSWYLWAGISKINLDWLTNNITYNLFAIRLDYGWLSFVNQGLIDSIGVFILKYNYSIQLITLFLEIILPFIILVNRKVFIISLLLLITFHLSVFFASGILFWQWIILEVLILFYFSREDIFKLNNKFFMYYLFTLFISNYYFGVIKLGWLDSRFVHKHEFKLVKYNGEEVKLNSTFFSPFEVSFAKDKFYFLDRNSNVSSTFGATFNKNLKNLNTNDDTTLVKFLKEIGSNNYNEDLKNKFSSFLITFLENKKNVRYKLPIKPFPDIFEQCFLNTLEVNKQFEKLVVYNKTKKVNYKTKKMDLIFKDSIIIKLNNNIFE